MDGLRKATENLFRRTVFCLQKISAQTGSSDQPTNRTRVDDDGGYGNELRTVNLRRS
jgi:hypothetical protein